MRQVLGSSDDEIELRDRRLWDGAARLWAEFQKSGLDLYRNILVPRLLSRLEPLQGKTILDLGCGEGSLSRRIGSQGAHVCAVDFSPEMIRLAKLASVDRNADVTYVLAASSDLQACSAQSLDDVVSVFSLQNIHNCLATLREVYRVSKSRGRVHVSLFYPGRFRPAYRPASPEHALEVYSLDDDETDILLRWSVTGISKSFETMTYFRPLGRYLHMAETAGFAVHSIYCWDKRGIAHTLRPSVDERVVELVLERS